jgi:hypothetical protein
MDDERTIPEPLGLPLAANVTRRRAVRGLAAAAAAGPAAGLARGRVAAQGDEGVVGVAGPDLTAIKFVGKIDQKGGEFTVVGFLGHVSGLDDADFFTSDLVAGRNETAARFTLFATASLTSRAVVDNIFVVTAEGELRFRFNEPGGADFAVPESFISGTQIATATIRVRNVINVQAPNQGLADGVGELTFATVEPFTLGERELRLGKVDLVQAVSYTGQGTLLDPDLPRASLVVAGSMTTLG